MIYDKLRINCYHLYFSYLYVYHVSYHNISHITVVDSRWRWAKVLQIAALRKPISLAASAFANNYPVGLPLPFLNTLHEWKTNKTKLFTQLRVPFSSTSHRAQCLFLSASASFYPVHIHHSFSRLSSLAGPSIHQLEMDSNLPTLIESLCILLTTVQRTGTLTSHTSSNHNNNRFGILIPVWHNIPGIIHIHSLR